MPASFINQMPTSSRDALELFTGPSPEAITARGAKLFSGQSAAPQRPLVSAIMPQVSSYEEVASFLTSFQAQNYPVHLTLMAKGDSVALEKECRRNHPGLLLRCLKGPQEPDSAAVQRLVDVTQSEFLLVCIVPCIFEQGCLASLVEALLSSADTGIAVPALEDPDKAASRVFSGQSMSDTLAESLFPGPVFLCRKSAIAAAGGFPEGYRVLSPFAAREFSQRVLLSGWKICTAPAAHLAVSDRACLDPAADEAARQRFASRVQRLRQKAAERKVCSERLRVLYLFGEEGSESWERGSALQRQLNGWCDFKVTAAYKPFDDREADYFITGPTHLGLLKEVRFRKVILTAPRESDLVTAKGLFTEYDFPAALLLNRTYHNALKELGFSYCGDGVDTDHYRPSSSPPQQLTLCAAFDSSQASQQLLSLLKAACTKAGAALKTIDCSHDSLYAARFAPVIDERLRRSSVYVCLCESGGGMLMLRALSCGLPVISAWIGNAPEIIVDGYNGFLFTHHSEFERTLAIIGQNYGEEMRGNARTSVVFGWQWREKAAVLRRLLEDIRAANPPDVTYEKFFSESRGPIRTATDFPARALKSVTKDVESNFIHLNSSMTPGGPDSASVSAILKCLEALPKFYLHVGGAGDALLLLTTFFDQHPHQTILSFANSARAARPFFEAFPELSKVYIAELPRHVFGLNWIRQIVGQHPNCLGKGATPHAIHCQEWLPGIDIFAKYGICRNPRWPQKFRGGKLVPYQVVIAPQGSLVNMTEGKKNAISPEEYAAIITFLVQRGVQPVIIGTPPEREDFPQLPGTIDRRSYSFKEQMELIASSDLLIAADSWAKTFSGLLNIPTLIFPPLFFGKHELRDDPGAHIFIHPWPSLRLVVSATECCQEILRDDSFQRWQAASGKPVLGRP